MRKPLESVEVGCLMFTSELHSLYSKGSIQSRRDCSVPCYWLANYSGTQTQWTLSRLSMWVDSIGCVLRTLIVHRVSWTYMIAFLPTQLAHTHFTSKLLLSWRHRSLHFSYGSKMCSARVEGPTVDCLQSRLQQRFVLVTILTDCRTIRLRCETTSITV